MSQCTFRSFLRYVKQLVPTVAIVGIVTLGAGAAEPLESEIVIVTGGGVFEQALKDHFFEPFSRATGVKVISVSAGVGERWAKTKAMRQVGRVEWDITLASRSAALVNREFIGPVDCDRVPNAAIQGIDGACQPFGVLATTSGNPFVYSTKAFPKDPKPKSWADFWDVRKFPGRRALPNYGSPDEVLLMALAADGVSPDKLYPLDVERAFRKLDEIKPHVIWWKTGDQSQQLMRNNEVVMAWMWSGRALGLKTDGVPVEIVWNQAITDDSYWVQLKGAPHPKAAEAFLNYYLDRAEAHAAFTRQINYETSNRKAFDLMPRAEQELRALPHRAKMLSSDPDWVAANRARLVEQWNVWLAR